MTNPEKPSGAASARLEFLEVLTVGLPFCGFKLLAGGLYFSGGGTASPFFQSLGFLLIALGTVDLGINLTNGAWLLLKRARVLDACFFAVLSRHAGRRSHHPRWAWQDFGNSADVLLSFILVALVVGTSAMKGMTADQVSTWNLCVVLNVLGAGLTRFGTSLKKLTSPGPSHSRN